jgi:hypothetical protein
MPSATLQTDPGQAAHNLRTQAFNDCLKNRVAEAPRRPGWRRRSIAIVAAASLYSVDAETLLAVAKSADIWTRRRLC